MTVCPFCKDANCVKVSHRQAEEQGRQRIMELIGKPCEVQRSTWKIIEDMMKDNMDDLSAGILTGEVIHFIDNHVQSVLMELVGDLGMGISKLEETDLVPNSFKDGYETALSDMLVAVVRKKIVQYKKS